MVRKCGRVVFRDNRRGSPGRANKAMQRTALRAAADRRAVIRTRRFPCRGSTIYPLTYYDPPMSCLHEKVDTPIARLAMLCSAEGVGCYQCKSQISLRPRVRLVAWAFFLSIPMVPVLMGMPFYVVWISVAVSSIFVTTPLVLRSALLVSPMRTGEGA